MPAARTRTEARASKSAPKKAPGRKPRAEAGPRPSLEETMRELEKAGSAQTRKTYARHGAQEPMFGVSFATLASMVKRIGVDHDLARALWETGNYDARNLAFKVADPARISDADLDRWARETTVMWGGYVAMLAAEGPRGLETAKRWLASREDSLRRAGWYLVAQLAARDPNVPDAWLLDRLAEIERSVHAAPNSHRDPMVGALVAIGGRGPALRKAATAAATRIGKVEVDHGDTSCKSPDALEYLEKNWARAKEKGYASPAEQERDRGVPRLRC
jgi:3-methyladenine DNA glycosylase AlkD